MSTFMWMKRRFARPAFAVALAMVALSACSPEPAPAQLSYMTDVQPLLNAHCVRCHGQGGTLNPMTGLNTTSPKPNTCYFTQYADPGDCTAVDGGVNPDCKRGTGYCANMIPSFINLPTDTKKRMPPAPYAPLTTWEKDVLNRFAANPMNN